MPLTGQALKNWCRPAEIGHTYRYFINYFGIGTCVVMFYDLVGPSKIKHFVKGKRPACIELKKKNAVCRFLCVFYEHLAPQNPCGFPADSAAVISKSILKGVQ